MSLRLRLVLATVLVGGIGLLGMNVAVARFVRHNLTARLDAQVREVSSRFGLVRFRDTLRLPSEPFRQVRRAPSATGETARSGAGPAASTPDPASTSATAASSVPGTGVPGSGGTIGSTIRSISPPRPRERRALPAGEVYTDVRDTKGRLLADPRVFSLDEDSALTLDLPDRLPEPTATGTMFTVRGSGGTAGTYRAAYTSVVSAEGQRFNVLTALPAGELTSTLDRLRRIQEVATAFVLALIATCAWLAVRFSLRPLKRIEDAAATIAAGDLSHRIADAGPRTEIGRLGHSLNRMMSQIESAFAEKEASQEQLRRFLADASHELRTPLTAIRGYAQLHRRMQPNADAATETAMTRIEDASVRMSTIVEDLLALARQEHGLSVVRKPVSVGDLLVNVVDDARMTAPERTIELRLCDPGIVSADRSRLHQAVANLVDNALQHTPPDSPLEVSAVTTADRVRVAVRDHGPGIPDEHLPHLFEPFYRVDPGRSRHTGGAGLGLAIADTIVRAHGGTITAASCRDGGAEFVIELPVDGRDGTAATGPGAAEPPYPEGMRLAPGSVAVGLAR